MSQPAIDVHAHHVPADFLRRLREAGTRKSFPHCQIEDVAGGGARLKIGDEPWTRPVAPGLLKIDARTERLADRAIVAQLNGGWLDVFGYSLPAEEGAAWSAFLNDTLRESLASASTPDVTYLPLATVPLQDGMLAATELARAASDGHAGAMIGTWIPTATGGRDLDDPDLDAFWNEAALLGMPVFIHPAFAGGGGDKRIHDNGLANAIARPNETALAMARLLYGGVLERHPALKLIVAHGGGALPAVLGRLTRNYDLVRATGDAITDPSAGFARLYFDSVVFSPHALRALLAVARPDGVMLGSDDPFPIGDPQPRAVIEAPELNLDEASRRKLLGGNACEIFEGLQSCCGHLFAGC
jgi:aminocarboxymuconate-semialdehyde decarboxylase